MYTLKKNYNKKRKKNKKCFAIKIKPPNMKL